MSQSDESRAGESQADDTRADENGADETRIEHELHRVAASNDPFAAAVRTTRMPMLITDPARPDNPVVFANDAFLLLTGYERDELLGRNCRFLQGPGTNSDDITKVRNAIARQEPIEIDLLNYRKDGSSFWNRVLISPVFDDQGKLTYFFASQFDVTPERRRIAEMHVSQEELETQIEQRIQDLRASENRLRFILEAAKMGSWTLELATKRLIVSAQAKANLGLAPADRLTLEDVRKAVDPADLEDWSAGLERTISGEQDLHMVYRIRTPNGELRWLEARGQLSGAPDGHQFVSGITQDITERKEAEEHRKLLARELNHRVKNSLAIAQSIFSQSLKSAGSIDEAQKIAFGRIHAMSTAQDLLTKEGWNSAELRALVGDVMEPFKGADIRIGGPRVILNAQAVSALSLALYELATNATKYGALSVPGGSVTIHWEIVKNDRRTLHFHWSEMGGPPVEPPKNVDSGRA
nr:PAS domain S-box protein [Marinicella sp. W31]MDC2875870.1 PAS domain S-box protein [Marinicella sp. W31]